GREPEDPQRRFRDHRGSAAAALIEQGHLAEGRPRAERCAPLTVGLDARRALGDDEEPDPALTLADDHVAGVVASLLCSVGDCRELLVGGPIKERDSSQDLGALVSHATPLVAMGEAIVQRTRTRSASGLWHTDCSGEVSELA